MVGQKRTYSSAFRPRVAFARPKYARTTYGRTARSNRPLSLGLAPLRTGGFYGVAARRSKNEKKVVDVDTATYQCDSTGSITLLNGIATGTDFTNRIGRKTCMKSLYIRGVIRPDDNNVGNTLARIVVVYDMQANGVAPTLANLFKESGTGILATTSQLNLDNRDRFRVLWDKCYALGATSDAATQAFAGSPTTFPIKKYKKLNLETIYNGTTAAIGSIATGSLYMFTIGNQAAGNAAEAVLSTRIRFEDA